MPVPFERICAALFDRPHFYHPGKAETLLRMMGPRLTGQSIVVVNGGDPIDHAAFANGRPSAGVIGDRMGRAFDEYGYQPFDVVENVAIIAVEGTLVHKGAWIGQSSGETSYQGLITQCVRAERSSAIKGAVVEVDSFGGQVNGAFEAAAALRSLAKAKPTIAILTDFAYSAGYMIASQARQIIMPEFGGAGSIGVVMMHADSSVALEQEGIKVTFIHSGKHRVEGNPYAALPEALRDKWQAECDAMRDRFAQVVHQGRGKRLTKLQALKTEAQAFTANEALELGLVDAVGDGQEAFTAFIKEINRKV